MPDLIRKIYHVTKEPADEDNTAIAAISTGIVDRDKEVLLPNGMKFDNWIQRPSVMWAHDYRSFPLGKGYWLKPGRKTIKAKWEWTPLENAQEARLLWENDFLGAASVGFLPIKSHIPTSDDIKKHPEWADAQRIYDEWELLEFSIVPVPANPEALALAIKNKQISISKEMQSDLGIEEEKTFYTEPFLRQQRRSEGKRDEKQTYNCECIKCGHKLVTEKHCNEIKCPKCGGEMRRAERPGPGRSVEAEKVEVKTDPILKPEETENYIRIPVRDCKITATITISAKEGIKGLYCGKIKKVATYLFDKAKGWTMAKAKKWAKEHDGKGVTEKVEGVRVKKPVKEKPKVFVVKSESDYEKQVDKVINRKLGIVFMQ